MRRRKQMQTLLFSAALLTGLLFSSSALAGDVAAAKKKRKLDPWLGAWRVSGLNLPPDDLTIEFQRGKNFLLHSQADPAISGSSNPRKIGAKELIIASAGSFKFMPDLSAQFDILHQTVGADGSFNAVMTDPALDSFEGTFTSGGFPHSFTAHYVDEGQTTLVLNLNPVVARQRRMIRPGDMLRIAVKIANRGPSPLRVDNLYLGCGVKGPAKLEAWTPADGLIRCERAADNRNGLVCRNMAWGMRTEVEGIAHYKIDENPSTRKLTVSCGVTSRNIDFRTTRRVLKLKVKKKSTKGCSRIAGTWDWFTGVTVNIGAGGSLSTVHPTLGAMSGTWNCLDAKSRKYELRWSWQGGIFIDTVTATSDYNRLSGTNQEGTAISGRRHGTGPTPTPTPVSRKWAVYVLADDLTCCENPDGSPTYLYHEGLENSLPTGAITVQGGFDSLDDLRTWVCSHEIHFHYWNSTWARLNGKYVSQTRCQINT